METPEQTNAQPSVDGTDHRHGAVPIEAPTRAHEYSCDQGCCKYYVARYLRDKNEVFPPRVNRKAGIVVHDMQGGYILLVQSRGWLWGCPKGTLCMQESLEECAIREVREETGLEFDKSALTFKIDINSTNTYYVINTQRGAVRVQDHIPNNDAMGIGWFRVECLPSLIRSGKIALNQHSKRLLCAIFSLDRRQLSSSPQVDAVEDWRASARALRAASPASLVGYG